VSGSRAPGALGRPGLLALGLWHLAPGGPSRYAEAMRSPLAAVLLLAAGSASAGPIARLTPLSTPMSRPATLALQSLLSSDPAYAGALSVSPTLQGVLALSPDSPRDRQALGLLAARLPRYYDASQLTLAALSASAGAQDEIGSRLLRAARAVDRGEMSRRALKSELASLEAYGVYGAPAESILGTARLASARLAAGERSKRVAAALMAGVRDDLAGHPDEAVYGEYGRPLPGPAPQQRGVAAELEQRLEAMGARLTAMGFVMDVDESARAYILAKTAGSADPSAALHLLMSDAEQRATGALQDGRYPPGTRLRLKTGVDGGLVLRWEEP
jgi:hypothetical protein